MLIPKSLVTDQRELSVNSSKPDTFCSYDFRALDRAHFEQSDRLISIQFSVCLSFCQQCSVNSVHSTEFNVIRHNSEPSRKIPTQRHSNTFVARCCWPPKIVRTVRTSIVLSTESIESIGTSLGGRSCNAESRMQITALQIEALRSTMWSLQAC